MRYTLHDEFEFKMLPSVQNSAVISSSKDFLLSHCFQYTESELGPGLSDCKVIQIPIN